MPKKGLLDPISPELEPLEEGLADPSFSPLQGSEEAGPEEEQALGEALAAAMDFAYSEEGMAKIVQVFQQDDRPLFESVADIGAMLVQKALTEIPAQDKDTKSAIVFGEGGLLQQVPPLLFEIAEQIGRPGAEDPDQLSAAVINLYKKAGEHVLESGDEQAKQEVQELGQEVALAGEDDPQKFAKRVAKEEENDLSSSIKKGLLGV